MYSSVHAPSNMMTVGHYNRSGSANSFPMRSGRSDGSSEEELMVCILCPNEKIGSMIGKGGSIIRKLREESAAKIRVCDQVGNADERVIQISSIEVISLVPYYILLWSCISICSEYLVALTAY